MFGMNRAVFNQWFILAALLVGAFLVRLGVRMAFGEEYFWSNSYSFYYDIAENVVSGNGFCIETTCAFKPPLYPLFLALTALAGKNYLMIIVPQALMGAGTALCAFLIGRQIFNTRVGILACGITAFYPYYVMHDTALQETGMFTFCTVLSVWLLVRASWLSRNRDWFLAGLVLGATVLVRVSIIPIVGLAIIWAAVWGAQGNVWNRLRSSSILLLAVMVTLAPWLLRNYHLTGSSVLSLDTGYVLWVGNNSETFSRYPAESIDRSAEVARSKFTQVDQDELERLSSNEVATSSWFANRALDFMRANPWLILQGAFRKLEAGFSWRLNPRRELQAQAAYAIAYLPVAVLGIIGMILARRKHEIMLIVMLFLAFMAVSAVFFAHTSHRTYLDVYWIVFAASVLEGIRARLMSACFQRKVATT
jgi:4-amino-4-deoxy-L-arabinose transferase-like glycosyltransferase